MIACCGWSHGVGLQVKGGFKLSFLLCCHSTAIIYGSHMAPLLFSPPQPHLLYLGTEAIWQVQLREQRKAVTLPHTLCFSGAEDVGSGKADAEALLKYGWTQMLVLWEIWILFLSGSALLGPSRPWAYWWHWSLRLAHMAAGAQPISGAQKSTLCSRGHRTRGNWISFSLPFCQFKVKRALLKRKWYLTLRFSLSFNCKSRWQAVLVAVMYISDANQPNCAGIFPVSHQTVGCFFFQDTEKLAYPPIRNQLSCPISTKWSYYFWYCFLTYNFKSLVRVTESLWLEKTVRSKSPSTITKFATKLLIHVLNATSDQAVSAINIIPNMILSYALLIFFYRF